MVMPVVGYIMEFVNRRKKRQYSPYIDDIYGPIVKAVPRIIVREREQGGSIEHQSGY